MGSAEDIHTAHYLRVRLAISAMRPGCFTDNGGLLTPGQRRHRAFTKRRRFCGSLALPNLRVPEGGSAYIFVAVGLVRQPGAVGDARLR